MFGILTPQAGEVRMFRDACTKVGAPVPEVLTRALELVDVAWAHVQAPTGGLLGMSDEDARARVTDLAVREHQGYTAEERGMSPGVRQFTDELMLELRAAIVPDLDAMVEALQPEFDEVAAPLVVAARDYGFRWETTSDDVIDRGDDGAIRAWREMRPAWEAVRPLVRFRTLMSRALLLSPTLDDADDLDDNRVSYSVCFAAGSNWAFDGAYHLSGRSSAGFDWFKLAAGGLRLNTPSEVAAKVARSVHELV